MNNRIQNFYSKVKQVVEDTAHKMKDKVEAYRQRDTVTIAEISEMIHHHPETRIKKRILLGLTYRFYLLTVENMTFEMETKGESDRQLLALTIYTDNEILLTYRSYESKLNKYEPIPGSSLAAVVRKEES